MKKLFVLLLTLSLMIGVFCITAVASSAEDSNTVVMTVSGMTENGSKILTEHYYNFESAWDDAARYAKDHEWMAQNGVVCIVVDLNADWVAEKGKFGEDNVGFKESTIYVPENAKMMINMQGHTIDRGLTKSEDHGEVIFMGKNSTLIINGGYINDEIVELGADPGDTKMGTITGGYSDSGAGGIHLDGYNNLVLKNVNIVGNGTDGERGAGIALFNESTLTMNGGSISNNFLKYYSNVVIVVDLSSEPKGSLYLKNSTATLNNVEICDNYFKEGVTSQGSGMAIYATEGSSLTMKDCLVSGNGSIEVVAEDLVYAKNSTLNITDTDFIDNCTAKVSKWISGVKKDECMFNLENSTVYIEGGKITGNASEKLFKMKKTEMEMRLVTITDNASWVMKVDNNEGQAVTLVNCTLNNNQYPNIHYLYTALRQDINVNKKNILTIDGGDLGDTTFNDKSMVAGVGVGSIFGEGSLTMAISLLALVASIGSICICFVLYNFYKKKVVPAVAPAAAEATDDEE